MKIQVNRSALKATLCIISKYDIRYYLRGAHIRATATHTTIAATNGYMAMLYRHEAENEIEGDEVDLIVPLSIVQMLTRGKPLGGIDLVDIFKHDEFKWRSTMLGNDSCPDIVFKAVEGDFPLVEKFIPRKISGESGYFNNSLVSRMFKAAACVSKSHVVNNVLLFQNGHQDAAVVRNMRDSNFIGIVMPMNGCEQPSTSVQDWVLGMKDEVKE